MTNRSLGVRLLCVRLTLGEAIGELQDLAILYPDDRARLLGMESKVRWLRDELFAASAPTDPQAREDTLDRLFSDPRKETV